MRIPENKLKKAFRKIGVNQSDFSKSDWAKHSIATQAKRTIATSVKHAIATA